MNGSTPRRMWWPGQNLLLADWIAIAALIWLGYSGYSLAYYGAGFISATSASLTAAAMIAVASYVTMYIGSIAIMGVCYYTIIVAAPTIALVGAVAMMFIL